LTLRQLLDLPAFKYITHVHKAKSGLPIRGGLARAIAWPWLFGNYGLKDWAAFMEVYGQPYRVGKYQPGATEEDKAALLRAVANIGSDAAAIIPQTMLIEFVSAMTTGGTDAQERWLEFLNRQKAKLVLGQTLTSDTSKSGSGSQALGTVHNEVRKDIRDDDVRQLEVTLHRCLTRPTVDLNLGPRKKGGQYPRVRIGLPDQLTVPEKIAAAATLVPFGLRVETSAFRDMIGLPEPAKDAEILRAPPSGGSGAADDAGTSNRVLRALASQQRLRAINARAGDTTAPAQDAIDALVSSAIAESGYTPLDDGTGDPLRALVDSAGSLEELRAALTAAVARLDDAQLVDTLTRALATARVAGGVGAPTVD
jgi:phage gp29-like protein